MNTQRLNITLPKKEVERLKDKPNKSAFIAEAIREKLDAEERLRREEELALAYREQSKEDSELTKDWDIVSGDGI